MSYQEQKPPDAWVIIEVDGNVVNKSALNKPVMTIGRLSSNDISVPSQRVSRLHAKILASNGAWIIEDAESLNGLVFQGKRVDRLCSEAWRLRFIVTSGCIALPDYPLGFLYEGRILTQARP